jgi:plastocyanin
MLIHVIVSFIHLIQNAMYGKKLSALVGLSATLTLLLSPVATHATTTSAFSPGDLIRGTTTNTVYYFGTDGRRYVFPNEKTYFTWYADFSKVKTIPDGQLGSIPLGLSNVTYRPGVKMIKITTDPKVYAADQGGVLRWVQTQQLAETLYGLNWKQKIEDVPDAFFVNYKTGSSIVLESDYTPADVMTTTPTISIDKHFDEMQASITIGSVSNGFVPPTMTIKKGTTVTWTNRDINDHTVIGTGFDSGTVRPNQTYSRTFNTVGSYDYHCGIHASMQGTLQVVN